MLLLNDLIQCNVQHPSLPVVLVSVPLYSKPTMSASCILYSSALQPLLRQQHSLPNKGSDLWIWSVYNIVALSSLANVIITKFYSSLWHNIFYKSNLSLLPVVGHDVFALLLLASRWRHIICHYLWLSTCGSGFNSLLIWHFSLKLNAFLIFTQSTIFYYNLLLTAHI